MNNVGIVAVRDYLRNVASESELKEFKELIARREREQALRARATTKTPLGRTGFNVFHKT